MGRPSRIDVGGYAYHVLNRSVGRRLIFRKDDDWSGFESRQNGIRHRFCLFHKSAQTAPLGFEVIDGASEAAVTQTQDSSKMPTPGQNDVVWYRIEVWDDSGTDKIKVLCQQSGSEPTWDGTTDKVYESSDFDFQGGLIGFAGAAGSHTVSIDDLTIKADRDANGSYETTEHVDRFTADASGYVPQGPTYDAAGNLTYDGVYQYTYDAWNRLVKVTKAYKEGTDNAGDVTLGSLQTGSVVAEYDAPGRRIVRQVKNSADLNATYHDYYDAQNQVETRDGSNDVLKQHVWATRAGGYIDDLIQIGVNADPADATEDDVETYYYALCNANYNVMAIVDGASGGGDLAERYEYTPYGQRTVFLGPGSDDPDYYAPSFISDRVVVSSTDQPYGLCDVGHQGLMHENGTDLVYNRARMLHINSGRFMQRDVFDYNDGMNLHEYQSSRPMYFVDPSGERLVEIDPRGTGSRIRDLSTGRWISKADFRRNLTSGAYTPRQIASYKLAIVQQVLNQAVNVFYTWVGSAIINGSQSLVTYRDIVSVCNGSRGRVRASHGNTLIYGSVDIDGHATAPQSALDILNTALGWGFPIDFDYQPKVRLQFIASCTRPEINYVVNQLVTVTVGGQSQTVVGRNIVSTATTNANAIRACCCVGQ